MAITDSVFLPKKDGRGQMGITRKKNKWIDQSKSGKIIKEGMLDRSLHDRVWIGKTLV